MINSICSIEMYLDASFTASKVIFSVFDGLDLELVLPMDARMCGSGTSYRRQYSLLAAYV
jgi:hypothetical protein